MATGASAWSQSSMGPMMRKRHEDIGYSAGGVANGRPGKREEHHQQQSTTGFFGLLQQLDVYAKVDDDLAVRTETGAAVTIGFWVLMVILCIGEVQAYRNVKPPMQQITIDTTMRGQRLQIYTDITFHSIPCLDVHVDAMDVAGENHMDIDHDMWKQRLDREGKPIGERFMEVPGEVEGGLVMPEDYCGSCFGAKEGGCCNTCRDVTEAYVAKGWSVRDIRQTSEQCIRDHHIETPTAAGEGCNLSGSMSVNKVSGNFHVAAGEGVMQDGRHVHLYTMEHALGFNTSHTINRLSFGEPYPGMRPNPLDRTSRIIDEDKGTGSFQYFLKLVPTIHSRGDELDPAGASPQGGAFGKGGEQGAEDHSILSSQFAYTYKFRSLKGSTEYHTEHHEGEDKDKDARRTSMMHSMPLPGVFFVYEVSPFMVEVVPSEQTPFSHLLIRLCAVAGGAFAVSGIVDSLVFHASNRLRRHGLLGK